MRHWLALFLLPWLLSAAFAQDERRVASPNGEVEFRAFIGQQESGGLPRLAYQVFVRGKRVIDTSFLGLDIYEQEPILGENDGLIAWAKTAKPGRYNAMQIQYMQNGSIGRLINLEARVWDQGVAFRYVIPKSTPLDKILIEDEVTEFALSHDGRVYPQNGNAASKLTSIDPTSNIALPLTVQQPDVGWIAITETGNAQYPRSNLARTDGTVLITRLAHQLSGADSKISFEGVTPLTCPWRVILIGRDRAHLLESGASADLDH